MLNDDIKATLAQELQSLPEENAERLSMILRGLFACLQDLNERVGALEKQAGKQPMPSGLPR